MPSLEALPLTLLYTRIRKVAVGPLNWGCFVAPCNKGEKVCKG